MRTKLVNKIRVATKQGIKSTRDVIVALNVLTFDDVEVGKQVLSMMVNLVFVL